LARQQLLLGMLLGLLLAAVAAAESGVAVKVGRLLLLMLRALMGCGG
jgi:hypothetical protein